MVKHLKSGAATALLSTNSRAQIIVPFLPLNASGCSRLPPDSDSSRSDLIFGLLQIEGEVERSIAEMSRNGATRASVSSLDICLPYSLLSGLKISYMERHSDHHIQSKNTPFVG
ncbi:Hypothetical protein R9X50_00000500 [Acrodontium crateriforme]|uniref:Uncharacterized protein n=1 Tax=Acrodontium crateriforme TaxID=150365 RepID=A0AAQ3LWF4_9PEZI|nr:Hypothetical protein R9X50_00000500 [Acrodontium crateriforme]